MTPQGRSGEPAGILYGARLLPDKAVSASCSTDIGIAFEGESAATACAWLARPNRAVGYWATNIGILWASFKAFGVHVPLAVVIQGFFLGMVANLFPLAPAGVGAVDAGMIGAFVLFGIPEETVFPAILVYRLVAFWMPLPLGIVAFLQLRHTAHEWERGDLAVDRDGTIKSKVLGAPLDSERI